MFVDIKSLVLLAQRFRNIVCTVARSGASPHRHKQRVNRFLKRFAQIDEFRPELLSALEHDIARIYLEYVSENHFTVVFKRTCTRSWMGKLPPFSENDPTMVRGALKKYIQELGLTDFGLRKLGLEKFSIGGWTATIRVAREDWYGRERESHGLRTDRTSAGKHEAKIESPKYIKPSAACYQHAMPLLENAS
jgi:hypothetical protein